MNIHKLMCRGGDRVQYGRLLGKLLGAKTIMNCSEPKVQVLVIEGTKEGRHWTVESSVYPWITSASAG